MITLRISLGGRVEEDLASDEEGYRSRDDRVAKRRSVSHCEGIETVGRRRTGLTRDHSVNNSRIIFVVDEFADANKTSSTVVRSTHPCRGGSLLALNFGFVEAEFTASPLLSFGRHGS